MKHPPFVDLYKLSEDERINVIGHTLTCKDCRQRRPDGSPVEIALAIDDEPKKIKRYVKKLKKHFPSVRVTAILPGLVPGTKTLKLAGPLDG